MDDITLQRIKQIKQETKNVLALLEFCVPKEERSERARCISIARTKVEECMMWAEKGLRTDDK